MGGEGGNGGVLEVDLQYQLPDEGGKFVYIKEGAGARMAIELGRVKAVWEQVKGLDSEFTKVLYAIVQLAFEERTVREDGVGNVTLRVVKKEYKGEEGFKLIAEVVRAYLQRAYTEYHKGSTRPLEYEYYEMFVNACHGWGKLLTRIGKKNDMENWTMETLGGGVRHAGGGGVAAQNARMPAMAEMRALLGRMKALRPSLGMRQEIVDLWRQAEASGYTLAHAWALTGDDPRRVCVGLQQMIDFLVQVNPSWHDDAVVNHLRTSLQNVEAHNEVDQYCLEALYEVLENLSVKKDPVRQEEWETVNSLARGLIAETKAGMCGGYRVRRL